MLPGFLAAVLLFSAGCSDDSKNIVSSPAEKAKQSAQTVASQLTPTAGVVVPGQSVIEYAYIPAGRVDPFAPIVNKESKQLSQSGRPPLERYTLDEFKLSGILWGGFGYKAMLVGLDGKGYLVHVGSRVGPDRAIVKEITQDTIVYEVKYKNEMGADVSRIISKKLHKKEEGMQ